MTGSIAASRFESVSDNFDVHLRVRDPKFVWFGVRGVCRSAPHVHMLHRAWVGDMRRQAQASQRPATPADRIAAPMPPPQASVGMTTVSPLLDALYGGREGPGSDADGAANDGERGWPQTGTGPGCGPLSLRAPFAARSQTCIQNRDNRRCWRSNRPDQQRHGTETQEQVVEGALGVSFGDQGNRGSAYVYLAGFSGLAVAAAGHRQC